MPAWSQPEKGMVPEGMAWSLERPWAVKLWPGRRHEVAVALQGLLCSPVIKTRV